MRSVTMFWAAILLTRGKGKNASCDSAGNCYFTSWAATPYSTWLINSVTISVGGWSTDQTHTDVISEIDLPGTPTPLPAALPLFISGLGALGLLGWRRKRKAAASLAAA